MQLSNSFAIIVLVHTSIKVHGTILLQNAYSNKRNAIMVHQHDIFDIDCFSNLSRYYQCLLFQLTINKNCQYRCFLLSKWGMLYKKHCLLGRAMSSISKRHTIYLLSIVCSTSVRYIFFSFSLCRQLLSSLFI